MKLHISTPFKAECNISIPCSSLKRDKCLKIKTIEIIIKIMLF